jgi:hypothetical protein
MSKELRDRIQAVMDFLWEVGQVEGDHHKAYVIDNVVRLLLAKGYDEWVKHYEDQGQNVWDIGVAP